MMIATPARGRLCQPRAEQRTIPRGPWCIVRAPAAFAGERGRNRITSGKAAAYAALTPRERCELEASEQRGDRFMLWRDRPHGAAKYPSEAAALLANVRDDNLARLRHKYIADSLEARGVPRLAYPFAITSVVIGGPDHGALEVRNLLSGRAYDFTLDGAPARKSTPKKMRAALLDALNSL